MNEGPRQRTARERRDLHLRTVISGTALEHVLRL
jgi:hypothetical protein